MPHTDLDEWPPPVPRTTEEFNALWDRVVRGEIPDPTPHGMGYDHCPYCFSDWKEPHDRNCAYKGHARRDRLAVPLHDVGAAGDQPAGAADQVIGGLRNVETVRLSYANAFQRLQNYLPVSLAEALLASARVRGCVIAAGFQVAADPARRYEPDEFEVGPAPAEED